ncbi:MAG: DUF2490 domain-containing protein [Gemmatimonadaceae bacterium]
MRLRLVLATLLLSSAALAPVSRAQTAPSTAWPTVHQTNGWYGNIYEQALNPTFSLMTDIQWRRSGLVEHPKQLFAVGGLTWRATPGVRVTLGGGYIASTPYGLLPAALPSREYLIWYQLQFQQHAGPLDFGHRYRYENRWIHDVIRDANGTHNGDTRFAHRLRYQLRASHPFSSIKLHGQSMLAIAADEAFIGMTAAERRVSFDQNRASVGIGLPLGHGERMEVSYMQQWIAQARVKTSEINNTLLVMFVHNLAK